MEWTTVIVTNVVPSTKSAFGVREDTGEQVFIPPSVSRAMKIEIGDIVNAKLVPNNEQNGRAGSRTPVPWFAPLVARSIEDLTDPDEVKEQLLGFDYPVSTEDAGISSAALQQAYEAGQIVKIIVMPHPDQERVIMWAADMGRV